ncbi:unnamed protein product [Prunus armeniaca]|uniref:Aminotransferase class I/classII large domain-containing protein n=1 Tax=Prunus armeniaca TaxID=36596 RepID=A0A6J5UUN4_PRUAR|nr:unnamed protein product [Prunus armeniaca]
MAEEWLRNSTVKEIKKWKQLIQSRGRSFIFSTATPVPIAAAAHAALIVARKETWRRRAIWNRVEDFRALTGIPIKSPIISLVVGSEEKALQASQDRSYYNCIYLTEFVYDRQLTMNRSLLKYGFHVTAIRPPTVPPNSCRLRVTLSAMHTRHDIEKLVDALSRCINFQELM